MLRNSPEAVSIRLTYDTATPGTTHTLDLTLRRGAAHIEGRWASTATAKYGIGHTPADAATTVGPYAVKATAADADGNTWLAIAPEVATLDTTTGAVHLTSTGTQLRFGVGYSIGTPATGINNPGSVVEQYLAGGSETVRVVGR